MSNKLEKASFILCLTAVVLGVLLFGAVNTYAYTLCFTLIFIAALCMLASRTEKDLHSGKYVLRIKLTGIEPLFFIMAVYLLFQIIPLPESFVGMLSPQAVVMAKKALPLEYVVENGDTLPGLITLAPYRHPVIQSLIRWIGYILLFWTLTHAIHSRERVNLVVYTLLALACFETLYGMVQTSSGAPKIWWYKKSDASAAWISGTYVNRNNFAGFLEMVIVLSSSFAFSRMVSSRARTGWGKRTLRARLADMLSREQAFSRNIIIVFVCIVCGVGLIFSGSRGGMISMVIGLLATSLVYLFRKGQRGKAGLSVFVILAIVAWGIQIGIERQLQRFERVETATEERMDLYRSTADMSADYRLTGSGAGSLEYVFPKYQSDKYLNTYVRFAHSDWLQLLAEVGIIGFSIFSLSAIWFLAGFVRQWKRRRDPFAVKIGAGIVGVICAISVHSLFDFNLHIPANTMALAAILAVGTSTIYLKNRAGHDISALKDMSVHLGGAGSIVAIGMALIIVWAGVYLLRHFIAEANCNTVRNSTLSMDPSPPLENIDTAIRMDPTNSRYYFKKAVALTQLKIDIRRNIKDRAISDTAALEKIQRQLVQTCDRAVRLNPFNSYYHYLSANAYRRMRRYRKERLPMLEAADIGIERAAYVAGNNKPRLLERLADYWVDRSKTMEPSTPEWHSAWQQAVFLYKKVLRIETDSNKTALQKRIRNTIWRYYRDEAFFREVLN